MGNLLKSVQALYLVNRFDHRRKSSMDSKCVLSNDGRNGEEVKKVRKLLPYDSASVFILALHVESIVLCNGSQLVISSDQLDFGGVF